MGAGDDGQTYGLTGPQAITYGQVAAELAAATGREIEFVDVPDEAAGQGLIEAGLPDFVAAEVIKVFGMLRQGVAAHVTATVETLTGSAPRSVASFARDHAHLFEPAAVAG